MLSSRRGHLIVAVSALIECGCRIESAPPGGRLPLNRMLLEIKQVSATLRRRLIIHKVTTSSRGREWERRVEITKTYRGNLLREPNHPDVVIGYDPESDTFVGLDPLRLKHGGKTHNASSFLDAEGLRWTDPGEIHVRPRPTTLRADGLEYQAFFKAPCFLEYLQSYNEVHAGTYFSRRIRPRRRYRNRKRYGPISKRFEKETPGLLTVTVSQRRKVGPKVDPGLISDFENRGTDFSRRRRLSPADLRRLLQHCDDNGRLGEQFVLSEERNRLIAGGRQDLAKQVQWISQASVLEGYDILSFEMDGAKRLVEVKTTSGAGQVFFMSDREWRTAETHGQQYYVYRVVNVRTKPEIASVLRDPVILESEGRVIKRPDGYRVEIV